MLMAASQVKIRLTFYAGSASPAVRVLAVLAGLSLELPLQPELEVPLLAAELLLLRKSRPWRVCVGPKLNQQTHGDNVGSLEARLCPCRAILLAQGSAGE